jgi:hypothetical protein
MGIEGFLAALKLGRIQSVSGRIAALMMQIEPQVGFVIYQAMQREGYTPEVPAKTPHGHAPSPVQPAAKLTQSATSQ